MERRRAPREHGSFLFMDVVYFYLKTESWFIVTAPTISCCAPGAVEHHPNNVGSMAKSTDK